MSKAYIFGVSGQAGYYLAQFLLSKGYDVYGMGRRGWSAAIGIPHVRYDVEDFYFHPESAPECILHELRDVRPDEIYNLASTSRAFSSWHEAVQTVDVNYRVAATILDWCLSVESKTKFFQAGSAEVFDVTAMLPFHEGSLRKPKNPYGVSKLAVEDLVRVYREQKSVFACTGILFNMESMRRSDRFFAPRMVREVLRIRREINSGAFPGPVPIQTGQLTAVRDWGLTREYVEAMWLMLQANTPKDYIIATGKSASCYRFIKEAFRAVDLIDQEDAAVDPPILNKCLKIGKEVNETDGVVMSTYPFQIKKDLGWEAKTKFPEVVKALVNEAIDAEWEKKPVAGTPAAGLSG